MTRLKNTRAFTLIELIVVIVIIGILAAVAAVSYNTFIANADSTAAQANADTVARILQADSAFQNQVINDTFVVSADVLSDLPDGVAGIAADGTVTVANLAVTTGNTTCTLAPATVPGGSLTVTC